MNASLIALWMKRDWSATVASLDEHRVVLRVADQVRLEFDRASIGRVLEAQGEKNA